MNRTRRAPRGDHLGRVRATGLAAARPQEAIVASTTVCGTQLGNVRAVANPTLCGGIGRFWHTAQGVAGTSVTSTFASWLA